MSIKRKLSGDLNPRALGALVGLMIFLFLFWDTLLVYPVKMLVVFFHELSHGLAAVITGGSIDRIELSSGQGGVCYTRGGSRFLTLTAGYLGSLLWGGAILVAAARTRYDRWIAGGLGVMTIIIGLLFLRPLISFGFAFVVLVGLAFVFSGLKLSEQINDVLLRVIGLTSCLYAPLDIKSDILDRPHLRSDAVMLSELTMIPSVVWGVIWILVATIGAIGFMYIASRGQGHSTKANS